MSSKKTECIVSDRVPLRARGEKAAWPPSWLPESPSIRGYFWDETVCLLDSLQGQVGGLISGRFGPSPSLWFVDSKAFLNYVSTSSITLPLKPVFKRSDKIMRIYINTFNEYLPEDLYQNLPEWESLASDSNPCSGIQVNALLDELDDIAAWIPGWLCSRLMATTPPIPPYELLSISTNLMIDRNIWSSAAWKVYIADKSHPPCITIPIAPSEPKEGPFSSLPPLQQSSGNQGMDSGDLASPL